MVSRLKKIWIKYHEPIMYVAFGFLTTLSNFVVYYAAYNIALLSAAVSNVFAWVVAVFFAFWANKVFVFKRQNQTFKALFIGLLKFLGCRLVSGLLETVLLYYVVDYLKMDGNIWKVFVSALVIVLNYVSSKFVVFRYN